MHSVEIFHGVKLGHEIPYRTYMKRRKHYLYPMDMCVDITLSQQICLQSGSYSQSQRTV